MLAWLQILLKLNRYVKSCFYRSVLGKISSVRVMNRNLGCHSAIKPGFLSLYIKYSVISSHVLERVMSWIWKN